MDKSNKLDILWNHLFAKYDILNEIIFAICRIRGIEMKFYLSSAQEVEPYYDLKNNKLMQKYLREIEKETNVEVAFEKDIALDGDQHIVVDIPSMKALMQIIRAVGSDLVIEQQFLNEDSKYPIICIYDDYIE